MPYRTHSFLTEGKPPFLRALKPSQIAGTRAAAPRICWLAEDRCYCNACHPVSGDSYRLPWSCSAISDSIIPVSRRCALFRISALRDRIPARLLQLLRNTCRRRTARQMAFPVRLGFAVAKFGGHKIRLPPDMLHGSIKPFQIGRGISFLLDHPGYNFTKNIIPCGCLKCVAVL